MSVSCEMRGVNIITRGRYTVSDITSGTFCTDSFYCLCLCMHLEYTRAVYIIWCESREGPPVRHCLLLALIALSAVDDKMHGLKILEVPFSSLESRGLNFVLRLSVRQTGFLMPRSYACSAYRLHRNMYTTMSPRFESRNASPLCVVL